ncbi:MAG TPA: glycerophosphodiester phosphodiesterase [Chloroflexota bacterium]|nr:glycerophosphodiester phosphodiesterase [Chloroflexota bacterium]
MSAAAGWPFLRIAHRGAAALEPENTLRGIETALRFGVEMVEIDTRPCKDGTLMVIHDDDLRRTAHVSGRVRDMTLAKLKRLDVGKGERIPTLEEALALIRGRALVNIDQKADNLAPQLLRAIDRAGRREETMLSGGAYGTFRALHDLAPAIHCAVSIGARRRDIPRILLARWTAAGARGQAGRFLARARAAGTDGVTIEHWLAATGVVARCKRAGLHVLTWTVDDLAAMRRLRAAGVDGITSNRPDLLMQLT